MGNWVATKWEGFVRPTDKASSHPTGVDLELLRKIGAKLCEVPEGAQFFMAGRSVHCIAYGVFGKQGQHPACNLLGWDSLIERLFHFIVIPLAMINVHTRILVTCSSWHRL